MEEDKLDNGIEKELLIEASRDYYKQINRVNVDVEKNMKRNQIKELEQEHRKAIIEKVTVETDGELTIKTMNTYCPTSKRKFANFKNPSIVEIRSLASEFQKMYLFQCYVKDKYMEVILDGSKVGQTRYVIDKLASIGAVVYAQSDTYLKRYVQKFWAFLMQECCETQWIPEHNGWYHDREGLILFWGKEKLSWSEATQLVK